MNKYNKMVEWNDEMIRDFWDFKSRYTTVEYAGEHISLRLVSFCKKYIPSSGRVLDIGCGTGALLNIMNDKGYQCTGIDLAKPRFHIPSDIKIYQGSVFETDFKEKFDIIFCMDVIEHLPDDDISDKLKYISNMLTDNGVLVITTLLDEDYDKSLNYCPVCQSVFHQHQHIHIFNIVDIYNIFNDSELEINLVEKINEYDFFNSIYKRYIYKLYYHIMNRKDDKILLAIVQRKNNEDKINDKKI